MEAVSFTVLKVKLSHPMDAAKDLQSSLDDHAWNCNADGINIHRTAAAVSSCIDDIGNIMEGDSLFDDFFIQTVLSMIINTVSDPAAICIRHDGNDQ